MFNLCSIKSACFKPNRDRKKPHGPCLPHHRTYGSRIQRFLETSLISCCPGRCQLGQPHLTKQLCKSCDLEQTVRNCCALPRTPWHFLVHGADGSQLLSTRVLTDALSAQSAYDDAKLRGASCFLDPGLRDATPELRSKWRASGPATALRWP